MALKNISQKRWLKGLNAAFGLLSQPSNIVPRVSNFLWTRRGSAITCDGTSLLTEHDGALIPFGTVSPGPQAFLEIFLYQPTGQLIPSYFGLIKDTLYTFSPPSPFTAADGGAGGLLSAGTYNWLITSKDAAGGETFQSASTPSLVLAASHKANLAWTASTLSASVNIYRTKANGSPVFYLAANVPTPGGGAGTFVDNIPDSALTSPLSPPITNSTQSTILVLLPSGSWDQVTNLVFVFPADSYLTTGNPLGGLSGGTDSLPAILQFANLMFLALGNGTIPYTSDGTLANTIPITNTFTAAYPLWQAATVYVVGDQIDSGAIAGSHYLFTATQSGTSGAGAPTFSATLGSTVTDNQIIWKNSGKISSSPAPRGAAHIEIYAGSIWVANTSPFLTTDQLDGPSALRMSDANNPNSWNPLNSAQIARDNGQQITGLKTFSVAEAGIPTTENLVVFKDFSTFIVQGVFGSSNFAIQQAQTDLGCIAARSIQFVPGFGIVRLTHLGFAVFDGVRDRIISEEIRPFLFGDDPDITPIEWSFSWNAKAGQSADPPMYVCAIPQSQVALGTIPSVVDALGIFTNPLPTATYYCKFIRQDAAGNQFTTPEFGPFNVVHGTTPNFRIFPNFFLIPGDRYFFYYGNSPGGENRVINYLPSDVVGGTINVLTIGVPGSPIANKGLTRICCYDLVLKAWSIIDLPFSINVLKQFRQPKVIPTTLMAGFSDGATRRWQAHDMQWDAGAVNAGASDNIIRWSMRSSEVYSEGATRRIYFDRLAIRGQSSDANFYSGGLTITEAYNGIDTTSAKAFIERFIKSNQFDARYALQETAENFHATISGQGVVEIESIDHEVVAKAIGATGRRVS